MPAAEPARLGDRVRPDPTTTVQGNDSPSAIRAVLDDLADNGSRVCGPRRAGEHHLLGRTCGRVAADRFRQHRSGGTRPPARRDGDRTGRPRNGGRVPRGGHAVRHDPVEPRHQSRRRAVGWRLRLHRLGDRRLQPDPSQRHGLPLVPGRADPSHRGPDRRLAVDGAGIVHAPQRTGESGSLPGAARPRPDRGRTGRHDAQRHLALRLPAQPAVQRPVQGGRRQQPGQPRPTSG